jgi:ribosomal protein S18 acetylase RimI-like enzyme
MSDALDLRQAGPADAPAVLALTREAYAKWVPIIGREPLPMTADYDEAVRHHPIDLLYVEGQLAALIEMVPGDQHLLVKNVAVSPAFQGRGYGKSLMAHAERIAASLGLREMRLFAHQLFKENITLYRSIGYEVTREEPFKGGIVVHMSKKLA